MDILARALVGSAITALALGGCYEPALRDCTVSCEAQDDCTGGQVCGSDGLCAAPELAGQCGAIAAPKLDAGLAPHDSAVDAAPRDAGVAMINLHVKVDGKGSVVIDRIGTCSSVDPQKGDCTFSVPLGVARTVRAVPIMVSEVFARWTSLTCAGRGATCTFTPILPTLVHARFERVKDDDVR